MDILGIGSLAMSIIDKFIPDPAAKAAANLKLIEMQQTGELAILAAQVNMNKDQAEINKIEAASDDKFKSRWRPAVGWICVLGLLYSVVLNPLMVWLSSVIGIPPPPTLDTATLTTMLGGLLGIGGLRSFEKFKGLTN